MALRDEWTNLCRALGSAVRARREHLRLSQEELGFRTGMDRTYISGVERGVRNPTIKVVGRIAKALRTRPSRLLAKAERS